MSVGEIEIVMGGAGLVLAPVSFAAASGNGLVGGGVGYLMSHAVSVIFPACAIAPVSAIVIGASIAAVAGGIKGLSWAVKNNFFPNLVARNEGLYTLIEKIVLLVVPTIAGFFIAQALGYGVGVSTLVWFSLASSATMLIGLAALAALALLAFGIYKGIEAIKNNRGEAPPVAYAVSDGLASYSPALSSYPDTATAGVAAAAAAAPTPASYAQASASSISSYPAVSVSASASAVYV